MQSDEKKAAFNDFIKTLKEKAPDFVRTKDGKFIRKSEYVVGPEGGGFIPGKTYSRLSRKLPKIPKKYTGNASFGIKKYGSMKVDKNMHYKGHKGHYAAHLSIIKSMKKKATKAKKSASKAVGAAKRAAKKASKAAYDHRRAILALAAMGVVGAGGRAAYKHYNKSKSTRPTYFKIKTE